MRPTTTLKSASATSVFSHSGVAGVYFACATVIWSSGTRTSTENCCSPRARSMFMSLLLPLDLDAGFFQPYLDGPQAMHPRAVVVADGEGVGAALGGNEDA